VITFFKSQRAKHTRAQGMVEFALALPVILLLLFGIIEFARLLVTFSAVYTASREAVRYAVANRVEQ
jgi:Flp pilus assembly protein TadG